MANTATQRGTATRKRLLDAATEVIPEVGWGHVSTRLVAERAGVNPALVHYHFPSLAGLLSEAAISATRVLLAEATQVFDSSATVRAGLERLLEVIRPYTGVDTASLLFVEATLAASRDEELRAGMARALTEFRSHAAHWLRSLGHPDAEGTALVLAAALDGLILHRALDPEVDPGSCLRTLQRMVGTESS